MKNYVGNGWKHPKFDDTVNLSLNLEKLNELTVNEYGDIKLTVSLMKEPNAKTKATHTVYENDYPPKTDPSRETESTSRVYKDVNSDLPF